MTAKHRLREVARFCVPERNEGEPYFLWYCECGAVGGRRATEKAAREAHKRHVENWG
jgi:hypothetical protein